MTMMEGDVAAGWAGTSPLFLAGAEQKLQTKGGDKGRFKAVEAVPALSETSNP